ncbi:MAG TPA: beta-xylosidase [Verrucomicrobiae bacterium]|nr:beta-xylosidase [Verrucomicrobiae bacterium]
MKFTAICLLAASFCVATAQPHSSATNSFTVHIVVDAKDTEGRLAPIWSFFGADEPNYATMRNGSKLLGELGALGPQHVYFRAHNLLTSGDGTPALKWGSTGAYDEDAQGLPRYNWTILDGIFSTYLEHGLRPYVEIGFMPKALSTRPEPYQHHWTPTAPYGDIFTGWAFPPKDYRKWGDLAFEWARHCVEKYGRPEVQQWYWEVWNEPNIGYWRGSFEEFLKLHDFAIAGVRRALPKARVGGPDVAGSGGRFMRRFLEHCLHGTNYATGQIGTPLDFVSFHAKGAPIFTNGHVRMGIAAQLRTIADGFRLVNSFPELRGKPIVIGESDPEGCAACQGAALAYRNGTMYSSYTAAVFARNYDLAQRYQVNLEGALTWAFEFEDQPYFAGFRSLASNGLDKPVLNVFRMFSQMSGQRVRSQSDHAVSWARISTEGVRQQADVSALASLDRNTLCVLVWHYHDDDVPGPEAEVTVSLNNLPLMNGPAKLEQFRVDETHSNSFAEWKRLGAPQNPTPAQYAELERAGQLMRLGPPETISITSGGAAVRFILSRQAVGLLKLEW